MKKYMKPIMESESFVANEYVSTCYLINCSNGDLSVVSKDTESNPGTEMALGNYIYNAGGSYKKQDDTNYLYFNDNECCNCPDGNSGGTDLPRWLQILFWLFSAGTWRPTAPTNTTHHHITVVPTNSTNYPNHPNAS